MSNIFKEEIEFLEKHETNVNRDCLSEAELDNIRRQYPNVPSDYISYLKEVGAGTIREVQFNVTSCLFDFKSLGLEGIYSPLPSNILFFGDNFSGDFAGFDISQKEDRVFEFWHDSDELYDTGKSFREYIRSQMLMADDGSDLRI